MTRELLCPHLRRHSAASRSRPPRRRSRGTADVVKDQAADLSHSSIQAGKHVAERRCPGSRLRALRWRPGVRAGTCYTRLKASWRSKRPRGSSGWQISCFRSVMSSARWQVPPARAAWPPPWRVRRPGGSVLPGSGWGTASSARWRTRCSPSRAARPAGIPGPGGGSGPRGQYFTRGLKDADSDEDSAAAAPASAQGLSGQ